MLKKLIILILIFNFSLNSALSDTGYDINVPIEGESIADDTLQSAIIKDIFSELSKENPFCFKYVITNSQIIQYPYNLKKKNDKYIQGEWKELWSVSVCGKITQIPISFYIGKNSTQYVFDTKIGI